MSELERFFQQEETPSKRQIAVALQYDMEKHQAPRVTAKGSHGSADRILEIARHNKVPIRQDADLVAILKELDLGQEIPENLYQAVAETLAFIYRMNQKYSL